MLAAPVVRTKPDPEHLLAALRLLVVSGPQSVMCGGHPMDVLAGQRVGARTVAVLLPGNPPDYFAAVQPDLVLTWVIDLLDHAGVAPRPSAQNR